MEHFPDVPMGRELVFDIVPYYFVYTLTIIFVIALIFYWLTKNARKKETAAEILNKRYAGGEIDRETFNQMKKDLAE